MIFYACLFLLLSVSYTLDKKCELRMGTMSGWRTWE